MTVTSPMEGITAPARKATSPPPLLPHDPAHISRRQDGWSAANQRAFLEGIAEGEGAEAACARVGLSVTSAYAFRRTAKGAAFALGWRAAALVAREAIAETLLVRALNGQVETYVRGETVVTRHRHDNRLALSLLARLDRQVEAAADADARAARLVAQEFDAFLDLLGHDGGPARAGLFLARRAGGLADNDASDAAAADLAPIYALAAADRFARTGVATAQEVAVADLDPAHRAAWTAEQWARAEAAGLVALACPAIDAAADTPSAPQHSQHSPDAADAHAHRVWWDEAWEAWRTSFPPPPGFVGHQEHEPDHPDYRRTLCPLEAQVMGGDPHRHSPQELAALAIARDAFFGIAAAPPPDDAPATPSDPAVRPDIAPSRDAPARPATGAPLPGAAGVNLCPAASSWPDGISEDDFP
ncbi:hypothetical protein ASG29_08985 [Sphingomonas sp. Leaf412]|uniref:hypothetical protein n=1 Tax=Sphingomonas sp. Leaf412 TaxID=1736370 RepID=UPI0006FBFE38|nr:hypothetical protein [Sphingomonas sp. Leaf412]KQT31987.1 hypothetical protein ASG29_08985 [Sphingomonas sp. Leaf412]